MTRFERWFINRVITREVIQGYDHDKRITNLYRMIRRACREEFCEDNKPTLDSFLTENFKKSLADIN